MNFLESPFITIFRFFTIIYLQVIVFVLLLQYIFQGKNLNEITNSFIDYVFIPVKFSSKKSSLKASTSYFPIFLLLLCVIVSIPFMRDYVIIHVFSKEILVTLKNNNDTLSSWLDFFDILISVLILFTVGGLIFTDFIAKSFKDSCSKYQTEIQNILNREGEVSSLEQNVRNSTEEYFRLLYHFRKFMLQ